MISDDFLQILRCPETHQSLRRADAELVEQVNADIAAGRVTNRSGERVTRPMDAGLVNQDGNLLYAVRDEIPCLLVDEAIDLGPFRDTLVDVSRDD
jgi:uncharacterized protein YbaR (Trm112 family)